jgi:hypothetical protein
MVAAWCMVCQSDWLPMMIPTNGRPEGLRPFATADRAEALFCSGFFDALAMAM